MGMRSANVMVVLAGAGLSREATEALRRVAAEESSADGATLWEWETNISPFWARTGTADLREEAAIFDGVSKLPPSAYRWIRADEDPGARGELQDHPLFASAGFVAVRKQLEQDLAGQDSLACDDRA